MQFWLVKQEPSKYSWEDFLKDKKTYWDGVRNYQARNNLQAMKKGDQVFSLCVEGSTQAPFQKEVVAINRRQGTPAERPKRVRIDSADLRSADCDRAQYVSEVVPGAVSTSCLS